MTDLPIPPSSIARNTVMLGLAQFATSLAGLAVTLVVSRTLGPVGLGQWRFAVATSAYLLVVSDAGLSLFAIREIARNATAAGRLVVPVIVVQAVAATGLWAIVIACLLLTGLDDSVVLLTALVCLVGSVNALSVGFVFRGLERMATLARVTTATQLAGNAIGVAAVVLTRNLVWLAVAQIAAGLGADVLLYRGVKHIYPISRTRPTLTAGVALLRHGAPFLVFALASQLIFNADAILIQIFRGANDLGLYTAGYSLAGQLLLLTAPLTSAAYPRLAAIGEAGSVALTAAISGLLGFLVQPVVVCGAIVADQIVELLYGPSFARSGTILAITLALPAIGAYNSVLALTLSARDAQRVVMRATLTTAAVSVVANVVLLPTIGIIGSAVAVVVAEVVTATLLTRAGFGVFGMAPLRAFASNFPVTAVMLAGVVLARLLWDTSLTLNVVVAVVAYVAGAVVLRPLAAVKLAWAVRLAVLRAPLAGRLFGGRPNDV